MFCALVCCALAFGLNAFEAYADSESNSSVAAAEASGSPSDSSSDSGEATFTVTFDDGQGNVIATEEVKSGEGATAPDDPTREGCTFAGWDPATFDNITSDLTVSAQWSENVDPVKALKEAIAALPDPKSIVGDVGNGAVADASDAYLDLGDRQGELSDDERLKLAECAIAVLPPDAFDVVYDDEAAIGRAASIVETLSSALQAELDSEVVNSSNSYGRHLENAQWAFDSLWEVKNATTLKSGTYTGKVEGVSSLGKSPSRRAIGFTVRSVRSANGKLTAILEHGTNASEVLKLGDIEYRNLQTDPSEHSYYEVPIKLNSTFHFSVKGKDATEETNAIAYEMTITADESSMVPDGQEKPDDPSGDASDPEGTPASGGGSDAESGSGTGTSSSSGGGTNLNTLVSNTTSSSSRTTTTTAAASTTNSRSSASPSASTSSAKKSDTKTTIELGPTPGAGGSSIGGGVDLSPAIAGVMLLFVSAGLLAFTLRFLKRESALA